MRVSGRTSGNISGRAGNFFRNAVFASLLLGGILIIIWCAPAVWAASEDDYILGAAAPLTQTHEGPQQIPDISGSIAVWSDPRPGGGMGNPARIFFKDLAGSATEQPLVQVPGRGATIDGQVNPVISGNLVAWLAGADSLYVAWKRLPRPCRLRARP